MTELESLALLIADLNTQVRALQAQNQELINQLQQSQAPKEDENG